MDHDELVNEMNNIERLTTSERLRLARKRRMLQLKKWNQREREYISKKRSGELGSDPRIPVIQFTPSVMVLEAAARNDIDEVRRLLKTGVSPDSTNEDGLTALHQCCIDDSEEMMKVLVEFGANVNAADSEQWTPLHAAATCGHLHLVKFLIENGANLLAVNGDGNMPYDICEDETTLSFIENEMAKRGVTQELIDTTRGETERKMLSELTDLAAGGGDLEFRDEHGATPLHIASANGYLQVLEFLLDHHVSTEVVDNDLWQPLHAAACWGHLEAVEILAQNGADINAQTRTGEIPHDITEDPDIKDRLIELAEQRLRLAEPRVRRGRSSSTRTHSIRRTSLRDKMKTTKKDVAEEGLIYMQTVSKGVNGHGDTEAASSHNVGESGHSTTASLQRPLSVGGGAVSGTRNSSDVVDLADVEISIPATASSSPSSVMTPPAGSGLQNSRAASQAAGTPSSASRPVQLVAPNVKPANNNNNTCLNNLNNEDKCTPPVRPARIVDRRQGLGNGGVTEDPLGGSSPPGGSVWSNGAPGSGKEPINIHVSVTINPGVVPGHSYSSPPGTLADLKRTRSQNRATGGNYSSSNNKNPSSNSTTSSPERSQQGVVTMAPKCGSSVSSLDSGAGPNSLTSPSMPRKKYAATSGELVGPPSKTGCCLIF